MREPQLRPLTPAQRGRLRGIAIDDEKATVIDWSADKEGPVVLRGDGTRVVVTPRGRCVKTLT